MDAGGLSRSQLWSTGSYTSGVTVDGTYIEGKVPDDGRYSQIYTFNDPEDLPQAQRNAYVNALTDPNNDRTGKRNFEAPSSKNAQIGGNQLVFPKRAPQIFNFTGGENQSGKGLSDAPVFGGMYVNKQGKRFLNTELKPQDGISRRLELF